MKRGDLSFQQIYNQLVAGDRLVMYFACDADAETFRTRMHHHKTSQEKVLIGLGFSNDDEKTVFSFRKQRAGDALSAETVAYISFAAASPLKKYPVVILDPSDIPTLTRLRDDEKVSANLGQAKG